MPTTTILMLIGVIGVTASFASVLIYVSQVAGDRQV